MTVASTMATTQPGPARRPDAAQICLERLFLSAIIIVRENRPRFSRPCRLDFCYHGLENDAISCSSYRLDELAPRVCIASLSCATKTSSISFAQMPSTAVLPMWLILTTEQSASSSVRQPSISSYRWRYVSLCSTRNMGYNSHSSSSVMFDRPFPMRAPPQSVNNCLITRPRLKQLLAIVECWR